MSVREMARFGFFLLGDLIQKFFLMLMTFINVKAGIQMEGQTPKSVFTVYVYFEIFYHHIVLKDLLSVDLQWLQSHMYMVLPLLHTSVLGKKPKIKISTAGGKVSNVISVIKQIFIYLYIPHITATLRDMDGYWVSDYISTCIFPLIMCLQKDERNKGRVMPETVALWNENLTRNWHIAYWLRDQTASVRILAVHPSRCIILGMLFSISFPQIPYI